MNKFLSGGLNKNSIMSQLESEHLEMMCFLIILLSILLHLDFCLEFNNMYINSN